MNCVLGALHEGGGDKVQEGGDQFCMLSSSTKACQEEKGVGWWEENKCVPHFC